MKKSKVYALCEGAIMVALATALSYVKLMELPQGGSVCIGMLPLFIYFYRWDWKHSFLAAFAYGLLQLIFDGAYAWGPTSMLLDYVLAFTVLGVATFFRKMKGGNGRVRLPLPCPFHQRRHDLPHQRADRAVQLHLHEPVALFRCL